MNPNDPRPLERLQRAIRDVTLGGGRFVTLDLEDARALAAVEPAPMGTREKAYKDLLFDVELELRGTVAALRAIGRAIGIMSNTAEQTERLRERIADMLTDDWTALSDDAYARSNGLPSAAGGVTGAEPSGHLQRWLSRLSAGDRLTEGDIARIARVIEALQHGEVHHAQARAAAAEQPRTVRHQAVIASQQTTPPLVIYPPEGSPAASDRAEGEHFICGVHRVPLVGNGYGWECPKCEAPVAEPRTQERETPRSRKLADEVAIAVRRSTAFHETKRERLARWVSAALRTAPQPAPTREQVEGPWGRVVLHARITNEVEAAIMEYWNDQYAGTGLPSENATDRILNLLYGESAGTQGGTR